MTKKQHDINFERYCVDDLNADQIFKIDVINYNVIESENFLYMSENSFTLYKKHSGFIYFVDSFGYDDMFSGNIIFDMDMILFLNGENTCVCGNCRYVQIIENDDGEEIKLNSYNDINVTPMDLIGLSLKIKEYGHTGFLK